MKIIIDCDQKHFGAACNVLDGLMPRWRALFPRIGWGHSDGNRDVRFFVRRITDGLSVKQVYPEREVDR